MSWLWLSLASCMAALVVVVRLVAIRNTTVGRVGNYKQVISKLPDVDDDAGAGVVHPSSTLDTTAVIVKRPRGKRPARR